LSEKSKTARGQCVGEKSTGAVIHSFANIFEASRKNKTQYFVDVVKDWMVFHTQLRMIFD
jgi:hypothetical protein